MNDTLQNELARALSEAITSFTTVKEFVLTELPDVIVQLLWWAGIESFLTMIFAVVLFYACYKAPILYISWCKKEDTEAEILDVILEHPELSLCVFLIFPLVWAICLFNITWLQILIAPKLYLIEYAAKLVR